MVSATRTRTQLRRDRAKSARIRMLATFKKATLAAERLGLQRPMTKEDAGRIPARTGAAAIRRRQKAKAAAKALAKWMETSGL